MPGFILAGLWTGTDKNGEFKLSGKSPDVGILIPPGARIQILPNQNRPSDRSPEYSILIFVDDQQQAPAPPPRGGGDDFEVATPAQRPSAPPARRPAYPPRPAPAPAGQEMDPDLEDPFAEDAPPAPPRFAAPRGPR